MKKVIYSFLAFLLIVSSGCKKDFFDINTNPNSPIEESMTPDLILPIILHQTAKKMATSYDYAAHWTGYWARSGSFGVSNPLENYDLNTTYESNEWVNGNTTVYDPTVSWYNILKDADAMEKRASATGQTFYVGIAKVIKSIGYMYLVDQYNNVPYSEAFKFEEGFIQPKYDKGQDIYNDLLLQLDQAQLLFKNSEFLKNTNIYESDIMFSLKRVDENIDKDESFDHQKLMWRKLVNTQRLKLLIRQSEILGGTPAAELSKITADGSGFLMASETAAVNPGYNGSEYQLNPFYNEYKKNFSGSTADDFNRANNYVLNKLKNSNDIRYQYYFSAAANPLSGNTYFGYDFGFVDTDPNQPKAGNSSDVAGPGLAKSATQDQWVFTSVESLFLQAEAKQRGWLAGDPRTAWQVAVRESFTWLGVPNPVATADTYMAQDNAVANYDHANNTDKLRFIVMQKYLSLVGSNNFEAWVDYRRLGVPADLPLSESESRNGRVIPVRLSYPQEEYNYNSANVAAQGSVNTQTSKVFWDK
ncbi:MAG: SusD/RagB family nutrient-binding outer membrane lipoprotein [Sphingobacteriaceae bacterium]|nr:SusD/RagB family nutrient-binding outer membrane lipoprotein [Sphingobacteriaceae bacterium]